MTCHEVQMNLSLYLYSELDFSKEEELENHVSECALCKRALDREKGWHSALKAEQADVPLDLLSACRSDLKAELSTKKSRVTRPTFPWWRSVGQFAFPASTWSIGLAVASFLVIAGFTAGRWVGENGVPSSLTRGGPMEAGLLDSGAAHVRDIQPSDNDRVRIVIDRVHEQEITGRIDDRAVRQLLLAATRDPSDPGIRVDSVDILKNQNGDDVRDALVYAVQHDPNAGVRLKALEGLRRFIDDPATRQSLASVLEHDENPAVRSQAIDVLAPVTGEVEFSPELAGTLQSVMRSDQGDDYVRMRCMQLLREMNALPDLY